MDPDVTAYRLWYSKNRTKILEASRGRYDPAAKAAYYKENADRIKEKMREIYQRNKSERNRQLIEEAQRATSGAKAEYLKELLSSGKWNDMGLRTLKTILRL